ncbi:hypothetical protein CDIK_2879 [Cucumispora dikerogammari]|nr:hypothetical protein CDIK_2879 [Cucumispora dikerogammari]
MFILNLTVSKTHVLFIFYITSIFSTGSISTSNTHSTPQRIREILEKIPKWLLFAVAILLSVIGIILAIILIRIIFKKREARSYALNYHLSDNSSCDTELESFLYSTKSSENIIIEASDQSSVADHVYIKTYTYSESDENLDFNTSDSSKSFCDEIKNNKEEINEKFLKENQKNKNVTSFNSYLSDRGKQGLNFNNKCESNNAALNDKCIFLNEKTKEIKKRDDGFNERKEYKVSDNQKSNAKNENIIEKNKDESSKNENLKDESKKLFEEKEHEKSNIEKSNNEILNKHEVTINIKNTNLNNENKNLNIENFGCKSEISRKENDVFNNDFAQLNLENNNRNLSIKKDSLNEDSAAIVKEEEKHESLKNKIESSNSTALNSEIVCENQKQNEQLIKPSGVFNELEAKNLNKKLISEIETINRNKNIITKNIERLINEKQKTINENMINEKENIHLKRSKSKICQVTNEESKKNKKEQSLNIHEIEKASLSISDFNSNNSKSTDRTLIIKNLNLNFIKESINEQNSKKKRVFSEYNREYYGVCNKTESINEKTKNINIELENLNKNNVIIKNLPSDINKENAESNIEVANTKQVTENINKKKGNKYKRHMSKISGWVSDKFKKII